MSLLPQIRQSAPFSSLSDALIDFVLLEANLRALQPHVWALALPLGTAIVPIAARAESALEHAAHAPDPVIEAGRTMADYRREITINGEPQGEAVAIEAGGAVYIDLAIVHAANLRCLRKVTLEGRTLCAVAAEKVSAEGNHVGITVPAEAFELVRVAGTAEPQRLPEVPPANLGYITYDLNPAVVSGAASFSGNLRGGVRLESNAFDVGGVASYAALAGNATPSMTASSNLAALYSGGTTLMLTDAAWRHNWFDERLSAAVGRSSAMSRGLLSGSVFDGISLTRDNYDNQGNVRSSQSLFLHGYSAGSGVLTYRLGDKVLKQIPLASGPYSIDPAVFSGLPGGGKVEIVGYDGRTTSLELPLGASSVHAMYKPGTWDGSLQWGRMLSAGGGYVPAVNGGAKYGVSNGLTVEGATSLTPYSAAVSVSSDFRLPYGLGVAGVNGAWQWRRINPDFASDGQTPLGWSLQGYYQRAFGKYTIGVDYLHNHSGGIISGGYGAIIGAQSNSGFPLFGSLVTSDLQLYLNGPLFNTGLRGTIRARSTSYLGQSHATQYIEGQLGGSLGRFGNWGVDANIGENGAGARTFASNVYWTMPIFGTTQASLSYQTNRVDGVTTTPDRYALTVTGNTANHWSDADTYLLSLDNLGYGSASYNHEFSAVSTALRAFRSPDSGYNGSAEARGTIALADDHVVFGRPTNDTIVILKAPTLPYEDVYRGGYTQPSTRTDGAGYAILPNPVAYRDNPVRVNDAHVPLGLEVPDKVLKGTVYPYRGYVVPVPTHQLQPGRLYPTVPQRVRELGANADVDGVNVPLEADGSFYVEDLAKVKRDIVVSWQVGDATRTCTIALSMVREPARASEAFVRKINPAPCSEPAPVPEAVPQNTVPAEKASTRLPYPDAL